MTIGRYAPWANGEQRRTWLSDAPNLPESLAQRACRRLPRTRCGTLAGRAPGRGGRTRSRLSRRWARRRRTQVPEPTGKLIERRDRPHDLGRNRSCSTLIVVPLDVHSLMERWCGTNSGVGAGIDGVTRAGPNAAKEGRRQSERFSEPDRFGRQQAEVSISLAPCSSNNWATDSAIDAARRRITASSAIRVTVAAGHTGASRRRRIPVNGCTAMTRMSPRRMGARIVLHCRSASTPTRSLGPGEHDDQTPRHQAARLSGSVRIGHTGNVSGERHCRHHADCMKRPRLRAASLAET